MRTRTRAAPCPGSGVVFHERKRQRDTPNRSKRFKPHWTESTLPVGRKVASRFRISKAGTPSRKPIDFGFDGWNRETTFAQLGEPYEVNASGGSTIPPRSGSPLARSSAQAAASAGHRQGTLGRHTKARSRKPRRRDEARSNDLRQPVRPRALRQDASQRGTPPQELRPAPSPTRPATGCKRRSTRPGTPWGFCKAFEVTSLKAITYEQMDAVREWLRTNRKAAVK